VERFSTEQEFFSAYDRWIACDLRTARKKAAEIEITGANGHVYRPAIVELPLSCITSVWKLMLAREAELWYQLHPELPPPEFV